jgi:hypothetical protein
MASKALPSPEVLRQLLRYEPETGKLFWLRRPDSMFPDARVAASWNARFAGEEAFCTLDAKGYWTGQLLGAKRKAHRVIWAMQTGAWPEADIDHENRIRNDNRWNNIRPASRSENMFNRAANAGTKSGLKGVTWHEPNRRWRARIAINGKSTLLGYFATKEAAAEAYRAASERLHGAFGRVA